MHLEGQPLALRGTAEATPQDCLHSHGHPPQQLAAWAPQSCRGEQLAKELEDLNLALGSLHGWSLEELPVPLLALFVALELPGQEEPLRHVNLRPCDRELH
eukprot:10067551-Alexandrium_andersonii.AAC.1